MSDCFDDGFEIPDLEEGISIQTAEERANALTITQFDRWINMPKERAEKYISLIKKRNILILTKNFNKINR